MSKHLKINALPGWLYPFVWIGLSWGVSMMVAGVAAVYVVQVEPFPAQPAISPVPDQPSRSPVSTSTDRLSALNEESREPGSKPQAQTVAESDRLPFLTLGLVAFSCALGCFLMSHRSRARQVHRANASPIYRRLPRHSSSVRQRRPSNLTASPSKPLPLDASKRGNPAQNASENATVTVLASEEIHPLDWNEPSVADHLDLRQRRPLSYWL